MIISDNILAHEIWNTWLKSLSVSQPISTWQPSKNIHLMNPVYCLLLILILIPSIYLYVCIYFLDFYLGHIYINREILT